MVSRLRLRFEILWDSEFKLRGAWRLPIFVVDGVRLAKRPTLIVRSGARFYPVFPQGKSADSALAQGSSRSGLNKHTLSVRDFAEFMQRTPGDLKWLHGDEIFSAKKIGTK
jgi:hypothetical protein